MPTFLEDRLPKLEDDEHDLILSPLFTPKLSDQAVFAELLGSRSIPKTEWPALIQDLVNRPTVAHLITSERTTHAVALREVSIERYVKRLRLDGTISESMMKLIDQTPAADHPMLKAVARRAIWESPARGEMLERVLTNNRSTQGCRRSSQTDGRLPACGFLRVAVANSTLDKTAGRRN